MMTWQVSGGAETGTQDFSFKRSMIFSPPSVPASMFALSAIEEWVPAFSHSDFTQGVGVVYFPSFQLLTWTRLRIVGDRGVTVIWCPDIHVPPCTSGSELRAGDSDSMGVADGLASGKGSRGLSVRREHGSVSLFLTTGIFLSGLTGGPTGFVCPASGGRGWPHSQGLHSCWKARREVASLQLNRVSIPSCLWSCCSAQRSRSWRIQNNQWPIQGQLIPSINSIHMGWMRRERIQSLRVIKSQVPEVIYFLKTRILFSSWVPEPASWATIKLSMYTRTEHLS